MTERQKRLSSFACDAPPTDRIGPASNEPCGATRDRAAFSIAEPTRERSFPPHDAAEPLAESNAEGPRPPSRSAPPRSRLVHAATTNWPAPPRAGTASAISRGCTPLAACRRTTPRESLCGNAVTAFDNSDIPHRSEQTDRPAIRIEDTAHSRPAACRLNIGRTTPERSAGCGHPARATRHRADTSDTTAEKQNEKPLDPSGRAAVKPMP